MTWARTKDQLNDNIIGFDVPVSELMKGTDIIDVSVDSPLASVFGLSEVDLILLGAGGGGGGSFSNADRNPNARTHGDTWDVVQ